VTPVGKFVAEGRECLARGDAAGALALADAALALDGESFDALQLRSRALYLLGREEEALQTLRRVRVAMQRTLPPAEEDAPFSLPEEPAEAETEMLPYGQDALETLLALHDRTRLEPDLLALLAELAEESGLYELARDVFEELLGLEPERLEAWEGLVHVLWHTNLDAALDAVARALDRFPTHPLFHEYLGVIHYRRRHFTQALAAYRAAINYGSDLPDNYEMLVQCYLALEDTETALAILRALTQREANDAEAHRFAIDIALECDQYDLAMQHAHQLVRLEPSHAETYSYKALVELAMRDWEAAARTLRLGFHKAVDGIFALLELTDMLIEDDALDDALRVADLACALAPDNAEAHAARGKVQKELEAFPDALEAFRQAAALAPQDDLYQTLIGAVLADLEDFPGAMRQFNYVLARHPSDLWTLAQRGVTYLLMGVPERAYADFTHGLEIDPEEADLYFWRACALVKLEDAPAALRDLRRAMDLSEEMFAWMAEEPMLDPLRDDPRFQALLRGEE
jgi:tetratricopeptide (TPR) repeat protein